MAATPVFLPGESHGWRSLAGSGPWGCKDLVCVQHTELIYNITLVSGVQHVIQYCRLYSSIDYFKITILIPCAIQCIRIGHLFTIQ